MCERYILVACTFVLTQIPKLDIYIYIYIYIISFFLTDRPVKAHLSNLPRVISPGMFLTSRPIKAFSPGHQERLGYIVHILKRETNKTCQYGSNTLNTISLVKSLQVYNKKTYVSLFKGVIPELTVSCPLISNSVFTWGKKIFDMI